MPPSPFYRCVVGIVVCAILAPVPMHAAETPPPPPGGKADISPFVWKGSKDTWLRDPNLFRTDTGTYILSGTVKTIIEYDNIAPSKLRPASGTPYRLKIFASDGKRNLRAEGFHEWGKKFVRTSDGVVMLASLPTVKDFNTESEDTAKRRSVYQFIPLKDSRRTAGGFPLDWRLKNNKPFLAGIYNGDVFTTATGRRFILPDVRNDDKFATTCIGAQSLTASMDLGPLGYQLCPGPRVSATVDPTEWNRDKPYPSEVRHKDGGGLLEGAWIYQVENGGFYMLYSSGDFDSADLYGGFVAVCLSRLEPCRKILYRDGHDVRPFLKGSSKHYHRVGRPYPVVDETGELTDIIFHARRRGENFDSIMRCTNFTPKIIENFIEGGPGCAYDDAGP